MPENATPARWRPKISRSVFARIIFCAQKMSAALAVIARAKKNLALAAYSTAARICARRFLDAVRSFLDASSSFLIAASSFLVVSSSSLA